jgi:beta-lactamase superfamily II metal-dependent hydrolase
MATLQPPKNGVVVRMYRQGHGDCFLLALPRENGGKPVYILIDCGLKPGSQNFIHRKPGSEDYLPGKDIGEVVKHIGASTGNRLDLVIITHEHQDHVNGIWKKVKPYFEDFEIKEAWFAWTESPTDGLAIELRKRHKDQLLGLIEARRQLALAVGDSNPAVSRLDSLLSLELGGGGDSFNLEAMLGAADDPSKSVNKQGLKLIKDKAASHVSYLNPGDEKAVQEAAGVRAFVLGPPRNENLLLDEDPVGGEGFPQGSGSHGLSFTAAAKVAPHERSSPFGKQFHVPHGQALATGFFHEHYGQDDEGEDDADKIEVTRNAPWRRIDSEWLYSAESLALKLNSGINNTSLVLAFELPMSKKILLFAGDAQRGNWITWDDQSWADGGQTITVRDILARTVLYKVGHHGSHNATLAGKAEDDYPNLSWMAKGQFANEFTAMVTAVNKWAMTKNDPPWRHPLPSIKKALEQKTQGRVFQTDVERPEKPADVSEATWQAFLSRAAFEELYFDYTIVDE